MSESHTSSILKNLYAAAYGPENAYEAYLPSVEYLHEGLYVNLKINIDNTGSSTLEVNSLGVKSIKGPDGNDVSAGDLSADRVVGLVYNGSEFQILAAGTTNSSMSSVDDATNKNTSNHFRTLDVLQSQHAGATIIESGWVDSFGNANEIGADEANSTGESHDNVNKLYEGATGSTNQNSDKDYTTESNYLQQEWTNSNQGTSQATVASGTTVTLSSGTWPTNAENARISFDGGTTFFDIDSRDSNTQLTLANSATNATSDYIIRMSEFDSGVIQLNSTGSGTPDSNTKLLLHMDGSDGSTTFTDSSSSAHTVTASGDAQVDTAQSQFGGASALFDGTGDKLTVTTSSALDFGTGNFTVEMWFRPDSVSGNERGLWSVRPGGSNNSLVSIHRQGSEIQSFIRDQSNTVYDITTSGLGLAINTWYHVALVRNGTSMKLFVDGVEEGSSTVDSGDIMGDSVTDHIIGGSNGAPSGDYSGHIDELRISNIARYTSNFTPSITAFASNENVSSEYVSAVDTFAQKEDSSAWSDINSAARTETLNSQNAYYWLSFDPASNYGAGTEVKIFNQSGSVWRKIARNNSGAWQYNNDATNTATENWVNATTNDMLHAVSQAMSSQANNRMSGADLAAITDAEWEASSGFSTSVNSIARGVTLHSTSASENPLVDQYRINYDSDNLAMDLRSKTFDPGASPAKVFLWAKVEHTDADGAGTFSISRNGGTNWETVSMVQQGEAISGDIRILRSVHTFTTGSGGEDLRARYVTESGKAQKLHAWGLQARD